MPFYFTNEYLGYGLEFEDLKLILRMWIWIFLFTGLYTWLLDPGTFWFLAVGLVSWS